MDYLIIGLLDCFISVLNFLVLDSFVINANEVLEKAINGMAFQFIRKCVIPLLQAQENTVAFEMVDSMLKQLIAHFPNKVFISFCFILFSYYIFKIMYQFTLFFSLLNFFSISSIKN